MLSGSWVYHEADHMIGTGSSDNYAYLVVDDKSKDAVIIDPANPDELVFPMKAIEGRKLT